MGGKVKTQSRKNDLIEDFEKILLKQGWFVLKYLKDNILIAKNNTFTLACFCRRFSNIEKLKEFLQKANKEFLIKKIKNKTNLDERTVEKILPILLFKIDKLAVGYYIISFKKREKWDILFKTTNPFFYANEFSYNYIRKLYDRRSICPLSEIP